MFGRFLGTMDVSDFSSASMVGLRLCLPHPTRSSPGTDETARAPAAVLLYALVPDKLMGWPWPLADEARAWLAPAARNLPFLGRLAGRGSTLPLERLVALKPDLIVDAGTVDATYLSTAERVWRKTGIPYVLVDGRLADSARQLRETGRLLGVAERGERLARYAETTLVVCGNAAASSRPAGVSGACRRRAGNGAARLGQRRVHRGGLRHQRRPGARRQPRCVSREQILAWSPEAIVTQYPEFHAMALRDVFWRRLPAVREGRSLLAPAQPFGWLDGPPSVNRLIGVRWLFDRLHRDTRRADWIEFAREFHALFYGHTPTREELTRLPGLA